MDLNYTTLGRLVPRVYNKVPQFIFTNPKLSLQEYSLLPTQSRLPYTLKIRLTSLTNQTEKERISKNNVKSIHVKVFFLGY